MQVIRQSHQILTPIEPEKICALIELAGRTAYKSEDKITAGSATKFIRSILFRGHESVIEHFNITVRFITDRGVTHEIVRHRLVSYTQESTRYCNYSKRGMVFIKPCFWSGSPGEINSPQYLAWERTMLYCELTYNELIAHGATPQEARSVLPNSLKTEIVCTTNIREWRHILKLRTSEAAHPQMRELMIPLLADLKAALPDLFSNIMQQKGYNMQQQVRIPLCIHYDTAGYPNFKPVCKLGFRASLKCHSKNLWCAQYKPSDGKVDG